MKHRFIYFLNRSGVTEQSQILLGTYPLEFPPRYRDRDEGHWNPNCNLEKVGVKHVLLLPLR